MLFEWKKDSFINMLSAVGFFTSWWLTDWLRFWWLFYSFCCLQYIYIIKTVFHDLSFVWVDTLCIIWGCVGLGPEATVSGQMLLHDGAFHGWEEKTVIHICSYSWRDSSMWLLIKIKLPYMILATFDMIIWMHNYHIIELPVVTVECHGFTRENKKN